MRQHWVLFLFPDHPVQHFGHKDGLGAFGDVEWDGVQRYGPVYLLHQLNTRCIFMVHLKIKNKEGLKEV